MTTKRAWLLVGFMWFAYFLNYTDRQAIFSVFPVLRSDLNFTDAQLGLTSSIFLWVYAICSPIAGQIGDRYSKRLLVALSLFLWSLVTLSTGLADSVLLILLLRGLIGVSESLFFPAAVALTANAHPPQRRSRAISTFDTAQLAGVVAGGWYGGFMAEAYHWRWAFYSLGIVGMLYAVPYFRFLARAGEKGIQETRQSQTTFAISALVRVPTYLILCVVFPAFTFLLWLLYTWLPSFLYQKFSLGLADAGFTATVYLQSATLVGLLSGGYLADRLYVRTRASRLWLLCLGLTLSAPCAHLIGNSDSLNVVKIAAVAFGLGSGVFIANLMVSSFEVVPANTRASAVGVLNLVGAFMSGFGALLGGMWRETIGLESLITCAAIACLAAALLLAVAIKRYFPRDYDRVHPVRSDSGLRDA